MIISRKWCRSLNILKIFSIVKLKYISYYDYDQKIMLIRHNTLCEENLFLNSKFKKLVNILEIPRHRQQCNIFSQISLDIIYNPKLVSKLEIAPSLKVRKLDIDNCYWNPSGIWSKIISNENQTLHTRPIWWWPCWHYEIIMNSQNKLIMNTLKTVQNYHE